MGKERIDYVRVDLPFDMREGAAMQKEYEHTALELSLQMGVTGIPFDMGYYYNPQLKIPVKYFNVWGPVADEFFNGLSVDDLSRVSRLDYRVEIAEPQADIAVWSSIIHRNAAKHRWTSGNLQSPYRSNRNGRHTGGDGTFVGGEESGNRITWYKRGKENPALEYRCKRDAFRKLKEEAAATYEHTDGDHPRNLYRTLMRRNMEREVLKKLLQPLQVFIEGTGWVAADGQPLTREEEGLQMMAYLWESLSDDSKRAFIVPRLVDDLKAEAEDGLRFALDDTNIMDPYFDPIHDGPDQPLGDYDGPPNTWEGEEEE